MSRTEALLDKLNLLYDSKISGCVSSNTFSEVLNDVNDLFCAQCFNNKHKEDEIESYKALLPGSSKIFSYDHFGLEKSMTLATEKLNVALKSIEETKGISKVM